MDHDLLQANIRENRRQSAVLIAGMTLIFGAVELTGDPQGLASALQKLERSLQGNWFQRILFPTRRAPEPAVLRTHPATVERVRRLLELAPSAPDVASPLPAGVPDHYSVCRQTFPRVRRRPRFHLSGLWY